MCHYLEYYLVQNCEDERSWVIWFYHPDLINKFSQEIKFLFTFWLFSFLIRLSDTTRQIQILTVNYVSMWWGENSSKLIILLLKLIIEDWFSSDILAYKRENFPAGIFQRSEWWKTLFFLFPRSLSFFCKQKEKNKKA